MTVKDRANSDQDAWPTWPTAGIPVSLETWRRPARKPSRSLVQSASIVAVAFVASRILGLAREVILARQFGTSGDYDAYVAAFRIPDLLFLIIMAGCFGSAFIPVFAGLLGRDRDDDAWMLASVVLNLAAITMVIATIVCFIFASQLVDTVVAPGLAPETRVLTIRLLRLLLLSPVFLGLGIAAKGILEGQDRFDLPALAPLIYNLAIILAALFLAPRYGIYGVAIGVVIGAIGHASIQLPGLIRSGMRYRPLLNLRTPGLSEVARLLVPRLIGQAAFQINVIVVYALASHTGEGGVSSLNYALQLMMLPHGVVALSISTVVFPTMARLFDQGNLPGFRTTFGRALRPLLFLTLPAAVGLFAFREAIVQSLFQFGAFSTQSTDLVVPPLAWFALGLLGYALAEVLTRAFYAMHDTKTPVFAAIGTIVLNIGLSALLVDRFGHTALAFSLSVTTAIEASILLLVLRYRLGTASFSDLRWFARVGVATIAMSAVAWFMAPLLAAATVPGIAPRWLQIGLFLFGLAVAGASYLVAAYLLQIPELRGATVRLTARIPITRRIASLIRSRRPTRWPTTSPPGG